MQKCNEEHYYSNQLEFTIHPCEQSDISSRSSSPKELPRVDDEISGILSQSETAQDLGINSDSDPPLAELKRSLAEREFQQENKLLVDLKAMKEEVWAKRKAIKLKRQMKKVQFLEGTQSPLPFCRTCCAGRMNGPLVKSNNMDGTSVTSEHNKEIEGTFSKATKKKERATAHIHSINMYENIIPKEILQQHTTIKPYAGLFTLFIGMQKNIGKCK